MRVNPWSSRRLRHSLGIGTLALTVALTGIPTAQARQPAVDPSATLTSALSAEVGDDLLGRLGVHVVDATTGATLFSSDDDSEFVLASNTKLFTTAAAMDEYGAGGVLTTSVQGTGTLAPNGTYTGDLYLRGAGDPTFGTRTVINDRYDGTGATVEELITDLTAAGITQVAGRVVGDGTRFDALRDPTGGLAGLTYDRGVRTDPPLYAAQRLTAELQAAGITVTGTATTGATPDDAAPLASVASPTMGRLAELTNKPSDNFLAEMLLKNLSAADGTQGTTADGAVKSTAFAHRIGAPARLVDGSGLNYGNVASPQAITTLLDHMRTHPAADAFRASLPVAGRDGTLGARMRNTPATDICQAKTGTLSSSTRAVSTLSGYCTAPGGHDVLFSILMNETNLDAARAAQDRMTAAIADYSRATGPAERRGRPSVAGPVHLSTLHDQLSAELADEELGQVGVSVVDVTRRGPIFSARGDDASVLTGATKLFMTAAVLDAYGAGGVLTTSLKGTGVLAPDGTYTGDLYLRGGGDPTFGTPSVINDRYDGTGATVDELIADLKSAGVTHVNGRILGDGTRFDALRDPTGGLAGLTYDRGVRTNPPLYAAQQLTNQLRAAGITVTGTATTGATPDDASTLATIDSPTMARLAELTNKPSDNFLAEMLLKNLSAADGTQGTTADGAAKTTSFARSIDASATIVDGSGLNFGNTATPRAVTTLLAHMRTHPAATAFRGSLTSPGEGSLSTRMRNTAAADHCHVQPGSLASGGRTASTLSGYCKAPGGHEVVFSILMDRTNADLALAAQDRMLTAIAAYSVATSRA